jgi:DNA-binding transcriptional LysR family regulator
MELRQLELFVAVAEERQFTRAAYRCHIGQSALSTAIRTLERELGVTLFSRTTRRVDLTDAGLALLDESRRTLAAASVARESVREVGSLLRSSLSVGGVATGAALDQAAVLAGFRRGHEGVEIHYVRSTSDSLIEDVRLGRLDVAFVTLTKQMPRGVHATPLLTEPIMLCCRADHPLAERPEILLKELAGEDFVGPPPDTAGGRWFLGHFGGPDTSPRMPFQVNDVDAILDFVANGLGLTLLPPSAVHGHPDLRSIPLTGADLTWTLGTVTQPIDRASDEALAFVDTIELPRAV